MSRIQLTGLRADVPIGAMAAFGCLRVCQRLPQFRGSKLAWENLGGLDNAVLVTPGDTSRENLVAAFSEDVKTAGERPELTWSEQIKTVSKDRYRVFAMEALEAAKHSDRETADWFAAFGTELVTDREGKIDSTPFDMSMARQKFVADALRLGKQLGETGRGRNAKSPGETYTEALFGPWKYEDDQHSLGWDPSTIKLGAFTYKAPTSMANSGVRGAVWLAFESLPLFPCFYSRGLAIPGFPKRQREFVLHWPVWRDPISLDTLRSLLGWAELVSEDRRREELVRRRVVALYRSTRFKPNKYLASFRPAELVFGGVLSPG